jgi:peptidoglycan/xylan/chitin deacetylase (PgdA/CDA1 family)
VASRRPRNGKREKAARAAQAFGGLRCLEAAARRRCLVVLCYHRVGDPDAADGDPNVFSATAEDLDAQIALLCRRYGIIGLDEALDWLARPGGRRAARFLITFDDGYLDNYDVAVPILRSHGATGTFFLTTSYVGTHRVPWWDQVAVLLKRCGKSVIQLQYPRPTTVSLDPAAIAPAVRDVLRLMKAPETRDMAAFVRGLEEACAMPIPETSPTRLFVNWEEAADMVRQGMSIGSHTHTHPMLAKQGQDAQIEEARVSRRLIEERVGRPCISMAYPVGSRLSFSEATQGALHVAGYRAAFSMYGGVNLPGRSRPFDLQRLPIDMGVSLAQFRMLAAVAAVFGRQY